jgi:DNA replication protein DnaC
MSSQDLELFSKFQSGELDYEQWQVDRYNQTRGDLEYYDCPKCLNRGDYAKLVDGVEVRCLCDCMKVRRSNRMLEDSGIAEQVRTMTFDSYVCEHPWQSALKEKCMRFVDNPTHCLFLGGQTGSGKTHLCTAVCGRLIQQGKSLRYVLWRDIVTKLQANVFDDANYTKITEELKEVDVLYIDDMFKLISSKRDAKLRELEVAFKVINDRELSRGVTVVSTECTVEDLTKLDPAIAGRIVKMATSEYVLQIGRSTDRDYRRRGLQTI